MSSHTLASSPLKECRERRHCRSSRCLKHRGRRKKHCQRYLKPCLGPIDVVLTEQLPAKVLVKGGKGSARTREASEASRSSERARSVFVSPVDRLDRVEIRPAAFVFWSQRPWLAQLRRQTCSTEGNEAAEWSCSRCKYGRRSCQATEWSSRRIHHPRLDGQQSSRPSRR